MYFHNSMCDGEVINKEHQCEAFIKGEREGVSSQQSAESLNGAYRELGYRDGPLVEIAEKAISREIKLLRDHIKKYRKPRKCVGRVWGQMFCKTVEQQATIRTSISN